MQRKGRESEKQKRKSIQRKGREREKQKGETI